MKFFTIFRIVTVLLCILSPGIAAAEISGSAGVMLHHYFHSPLSEKQHDTPFSSFYVEPKYYQEWKGGDRSVSITPFFRVDLHDHNRTVVDLRECFYRCVSGNLEFLAGINKLFWGVTESRHLVDVINQTDTAGDFFEEEKLGQPMVNMTFISDAGTADFFILPGFRERVFPDENGRLRTFYPVDTDHPRYESSRENRHVDVAARWFMTLFDADVGLSFFSGTCREPQLKFDAGVPGKLIPYYYLCNQISLDLQWITGPWLWKLEALYRKGKSIDYAATVWGFEYTIERVFDTPASFAILSEYQFEDSPRETATACDNDIFLGTRVLFNDFQSTEILAGVTLDHENHATRFKVEASRRAGSMWTVNLTGGFFSNIPGNDPLWSFHRDDFILIELKRYF